MLYCFSNLLFFWCVPGKLFWLKFSTYVQFLLHSPNVPQYHTFCFARLGEISRNHKFIIHLSSSSCYLPSKCRLIGKNRPTLNSAASREMWKSKAFPFISGGSLGGPFIGQPYPIHRLGNPAARHVESHEQTWVGPRTNGKQLRFLFCFKWL